MTLRTAFLEQARACGRLDSPFMERLLTILGENWNENSALGRVLATYQGDIGPAGHSLPLRVAGGLHALVLQQRDATLAAAYPPQNVADSALESAVFKALKTHEEFLIDWVRSPPQTNEVRRSAALIAMAHVAVSRFPRPIVLSELGASGGLNLMWDRFALQAGDTRLGPADAVLTLSPDWRGPPPPSSTPNVAERSGVDLNPLSPNDPEGLLRLSAYLWPDQPHRLELTRAAAAVAHTPIAKGDAIDWLEARLAAAPAGHLHLVQHTVAWQYFPPEAQARGTALIEAAGARATENTPLGWMQMENDGTTDGGKGAALTLRLWPGDLTLRLGYADFHGRWVEWTPDTVP